MNILKRIVLCLYALFIAAVSIFFIVPVTLVAAGRLPFSAVSNFMENIITDTTSAGIVIAALIVLFAISMKIAIRGNGDKKDREPIVKNAAGGEIEITLDTFESIAVSTLKKIADARDYSAKVRKMNENVLVYVKMSVVPEVNIPELGQKVQEQIIQAIESTTGIKVMNVKVRIQDISPVFKSKVE